jgi:hypothetical protein
MSRLAGPDWENRHEISTRGFEPVVKFIRRHRIDRADFKPDVDQVAAYAGGMTDREQPLSVRFARRLPALGGAAQFGKIQLAGIAAIEAFMPGAAAP